ncbi:MAG: M23 family metallopeptidase [Actinomycetota bacterium]
MTARDTAIQGTAARERLATNAGLTGITSPNAPAAGAPAGLEMTRTQFLTGGRHHPNVERWRDLVSFFFGQVGYSDEVDYAMMVMWGESSGNPTAVGRTLQNPSGPTAAQGLFQHMSHLWGDRVAAASRFWSARGVTIGTDPQDPMTNVAVAAWLRAVGGWGHWVAAQEWYKPGAWGEDTFWDGYEYQNLKAAPNSRPPRGDGQIAGVQNGVQASSNGFIHPLAGVGEMVGVFGEARPNNWTHRGIDLTAAQGTPIVASAAGTVTFAGWRNDDAGFTVIVDHGNGWETRYLHIMAGGLKVKVGDQVGQGFHIANVGDTGAKSAHLHFETIYQGQHVDPMSTGVLGNVGAPSFMAGVGEPLSPRDRISNLMKAGLDAISRGVAGGDRVPLGSVGKEPTGEERESASDEVIADEDTEDDLPEVTDTASDSLKRVTTAATDTTVQRPGGVT